MNTTIRWTRTEGDSSEVLTLVRIDGQDDLVIQVTTGPDIGDDFVGLYDLDGDALPLLNRSWTAVDEAEVTAEQIEEIGASWALGLTLVERIVEVAS